MSEANDFDAVVMRWLPFGEEPLHGVYWVCGTYPEYDIDVDDYGRTIGVPTGNSCEFSALVEIDFEPGPDGRYEVEPVNRYVTGDFDIAEYGITHYSQFEIPKPVGA